MAFKPFGKRLSISSTLVLLLAAIGFQTGFSNVAAGATMGDTLPYAPDYSAGNQVYLETATVGNGNSLSVPDSYAILYWPKNNSHTHTVKLINPDYCHEEPDTINTPHAPAQYNFYKLNSAETGSAGNARAPYDSKEYQGCGSDTLSFNVTVTESQTHPGFDVMLLNAHDTNCGGCGGVNAFKVQAELGFAGYWDQGYRYDCSGQSCVGNNTAYAVQDRIGSGSATSSFNFYFGPNCNLALNPNGETAYLRWSDSDQHMGPQAKPGGGYYVITSKLIITHRDGTTTTKNVPIPNETQSNVYRQFGFTVKPGDIFQWQWNNVAKPNGIRMWLPFDTFGYYHSCVDQSACVNKSQTPASPYTAGQAITLKFGFKNTGNTTWTSTYYDVVKKNHTPNTTTNPTSFSLSPTTIDKGGSTKTYTVNATAPNTAGTYTVEYGLRYNGGSVFANTCSFTIKVNGAGVVMHKIFAFNGVNLVKQFVRDNENFPFNLTSFLWPDAGQAASDGTKHLWLAGAWDDRGGNGVNPNVNNITIFNTKAEANCPGNPGQCQQDVPLAYVPQDDGSGTANTASEDGSQTPNGNLWYSVLKGTNPTGVLSGYQICTGGIAAQNTGYGACGAGGLGLNPLTYTVGGATGTHLKKVEVSNIHVDASNVQTSMDNSDFGQVYQGKQPGGNLQSDARNSDNLPSGSQNDPANGGSDLAGIWDNVHNPVTSTPNRFTAPTGQDANFGKANVSAAYTGTPATGNFDPSSLSNISALLTQPVTTQGIATSLLQDGHGNGYRNSTSEPFTLTGDLESADVSLGWDEYVNWNQVDDKGHWYTKRGVQVTGIDAGSPTNTNISVNGVSGSPGFSQYQYTTYYYYCYNSSTNTYTYGSTTSASSVPAGCTVYFQQDTYTQPTYTCFNTGWQYTTTTYGYYAQDPTSTMYGWLNSAAYYTGSLTGSNGVQSHWGGYESSTPPWAKVTDYMQDPAVTAMDASGATSAANPLGFWRLDRSDPVYTGRAVFDQFRTITLNTGWQYTQSCYWEYPNGNLAATGPFADGTATYYQNVRNMYENTTTATTPVAGQYNFTYDGVKDGVVDTSWAWASNFERVQYQNTFTGHTRKLGNRTTAFDSSANAFPACPAATDARLDSDLLGVHLYDSSMGTTADCWALPGRSAGLIYNPTVSVATGDVFAGQNLDSYFSSSNASSAFLFSNGQISHFNGGSVFANYYNNVDQTKSKTDFCTRSGGSGTHTGCTGTDPAHLIFKANGQTLDTMIAQGQANGAPNYGNLGGKIYYVSSCDPFTNVYHLNSTTFNGGSGTVIVNCNLEITGNLGYAAAGSTKGQVPSVGFIVLGNIHVDPGVTSIVGSYFANGYFDSGSVVDQVVDDGLGNTSIVPTNDPVNSDSVLTVNGLVIANSFYLVRQPNGTTLKANTNAENFNYDGRIVVNPPPGFSAIFNASAAWNETVPFN